MKQKMTFVRIDASDTHIMANLTSVAIHRGIQFMYVTDVDYYESDDAMIFFTDKFTLLSCIEEIKDFTNMIDDDKDDIWNLVQCNGEEYDGDVSVNFSIMKNVKLL